MDIEQEAIGHTLLPINNSNMQTNLFLNDCVFARQMRDTEEYWAPGLVVCLPLPFALPTDLYTIQIYNPVPKQVETQIEIKNLNRKENLLLGLCISKRYN